MTTPVYTCSPIKPFRATGVDERDNTDFLLEGFQTTNTDVNVRLGILYNKEENVCAIGVTEIGGEGRHIFLPTEVLKDLIGQFSSMVEDQRSQEGEQ